MVAQLIKLAKLYMCMQNRTHTEVRCLIWFLAQGQWPYLTNMTGQTYTVFAEVHYHTDVILNIRISFFSIS